MCNYFGLDYPSNTSYSFINPIKDINMRPDIPPTYYGDYLHLNKLLDTQHLKSEQYGEGAHDEMLFIIVHQAFELWFKQIITEMRSIAAIFNHDHIPEKSLQLAVQRLERIKKIQALFVPHLEIMETMTPMDFLEFRDLLVPASGFQSAQFREIEILMGLKTNNRQAVDREFFLGRLNDQDRQKLETVEEEKSLLELLEKWLERVPFTKTDGFDFWSEYENSVNQMLANEENIIKQNYATLTPELQKAQFANLELTKKTFKCLLDEGEFNCSNEKRNVKFSRKATLNALFILLYRNEPILQQPYNILTALMDIDENFASWRYRHAIMANRMLGNKIGTGGSTGHKYLKRTAENNRVFEDIMNLSTFIIPRNLLPKLPDKLTKELNFYFENN